MNDLVFLDPDKLNEIPRAHDNKGYVYLILNDIGNVKIGRTVNPKSRIRDIETLSGIKIIKIALSNRCSNYKEIENDMHEKFQKWNVMGEWFSATFEEVAEHLKTYKLEQVDLPERNYELPISPSLELIRLETEILEHQSKNLNSLRDQVLIGKAKFGSISNRLRKQVIRAITEFDNFEFDFEKQISVLIDLDNDYQTIKMILTKKYLMSA